MRPFGSFKSIARQRRKRPARAERLEARALLATFSVNSLVDTVDTDPGDGVAIDASGNTSLRAAVQEANALAGEDMIILPAALLPIQLFIAGRGEDMAATGDLDITDDVTIVGAGAGDTIVDIERQDRIFDIHPGVTAELSGMTIRDARVNSSTEDGGAVRNRGTLTIVDSTLTLNDSAGGGGAILNEAGATLTITRSLLDQNTASGVRGGGALLNRGTATIDRSVLDRNTGSVLGGGIMNTGTGDLTVIGTELTSNRTSSAQNGAGLFNAGIADVSHSTFHLNQAANGAAIYVSGGGNAVLRLTNSTLSGNFAFGRGGGIHVADPGDDVLIRLSTITENFASAGGGGLFTVGDIGLSGSIVAGNTTSGTLGVSQIDGQINSNGFNLLGTTVTGQTGDDIIAADPVLDSLKRNGGPTRTHRPLSGSLAVDNGHPSDTSLLDQRFLPRPRNISGGLGAPDIGAYEVQPFAYSPDLTDLRVRLNGQDFEIVNESDGTVVQTTPFNPDIEIIITGTDGNDSLIVDFSGGDPVPVDGLTFDGGAGSDSLTLIEGLLTTITHTYTNATDVDIALDDGSAVRVVSGIGLTDLTDGLLATGRVFNFGDGNDVVELDDDGIVGSVSMQLTSSLTIPQVNFRNPDATLVINLGDGNDDLTFAGTDGDYTGSLRANAGPGDDRLDASALTVGASLQGDGGADTQIGGSGDDTLNGNSGSDSLVGGDGNDRILGGSDRDVLIGGAGDDELRGQGSVDDSLTGGLGDDVLDGGNNDGSGNDVLIEQHNVAELTLTETSLTGLGNDTLIGIRKAYLFGGAAANRMDASAFPFFALLRGAGGADELIGGAGRNVLIGGAGRDTLTGNGGRDRLRGGGLSDVLDGGAGVDTLLGHAGRDTLTGGEGNDRLIGGPGIDTLIESADADITATRTRLTGVGTDVLRQIERLSLTGGPGDNRLDVSQFDRPTTVDGQGGNDTIIGSAAADTLSGGEGDDSILGRNGNDQLFGGIGDDTLNGGDGNDVLDAGAGNDGLSGGTGSDQLVGGDNSDTLYGGDGDDALSGGAGDDTVQGGLGDDAVNGDAGADILTGGIGDGVAQGGDIFDTPGESDEFFSLNPVPDWVDQV
jgi:Ca2+-binding RTX toxin-like protein